MHGKMEVKNATLLFAGIIALVLGTLIIIFDYPQLQYFESLGKESGYRLDLEKKSIHERMAVGFTVAVIITIAGIILLGMSFLKGFQNGIRQ